MTELDLLQEISGSLVSLLEFARLGLIALGVLCFGLGMLCGLLSMDY